MSLGKKQAVLLGAGGAGLVVSSRALRGLDRVRKQVTPVRRYWEKHLLNSLARLETLTNDGAFADTHSGPKPLIYLALGDSAAQGIGARQVTEGYVPRLADTLGQISGREVILLNISLSGATAASVLATQLPQLSGLRVAGNPVKPDLITLDIGSNDVGILDLTVDEFGKQMEAIYAALPGPTFIADIPSFRPLRTEKRACQMSEVMRAALEGTAHTLVPLEKYTTEMTLWSYLVRHAGDVFHPSSQAYAEWADLFISVISPAKISILEI